MVFEELKTWYFPYSEFRSTGQLGRRYSSPLGTLLTVNDSFLKKLRTYTLKLIDVFRRKPDKDLDDIRSEHV